MKILFVCTGNICRSPIAERMLAERSSALDLGLVVSSAGTRARNGLPMHPESQRTLRDRGLDADGFVSRMLTARVVAENDLILGLGRDHRTVARQLMPARWKRVILLREVPRAVGDSLDRGAESIDAHDPTLDIADPIGRGAAVFDTVAADIEIAVDILTASIVRNPGRTSVIPWLP